MFLDQNNAIKILFAGFLNGLRIGRKIRYDRKKYFYRFQYNKREQQDIINERDGQISSSEK